MTKENELAKFKSQVIKYGIIIAIICELISLPFLGFHLRFAYGLTLGTSIAIVNFYFLAFTAQRMLDRRGGAGLAVMGYMLRLFLYGGGFYMAYKLGTASGLASLLGFMTLKIAIYYVYGFKPKFSESSAKGKKLNDLDRDEWAKEGKRHWYTEIFKGLKPQPWPEEQDAGPEGGGPEDGGAASAGQASADDGPEGAGPAAGEERVQGQRLKEEE